MVLRRPVDPTALPAVGMVIPDDPAHMTTDHRTAVTAAEGTETVVMAAQEASPAATVSR